jgi:hypothetical protein
MFGKSRAAAGSIHVVAFVEPPIEVGDARLQELAREMSRPRPEPAGVLGDRVDVADDHALQRVVGCP